MMMVLLILQGKKPELREVNELGPGHRAVGWQTCAC